MAADLETPGLVVGEMPMQHIELVQRHRVDEAANEIRRLVVARRIEHQAAPRKARRIRDVDGGKRERRAAVRRAGELPQRDAAIEKPRVSRCGHGRAPRRHRDGIALGAERRTRVALEVDGAVGRGAAPRRGLARERLREEFAQRRRGAARVAIAAHRDERERAVDAQFAIAQRDPRRLRDDRGLGRGERAGARRGDPGADEECASIHE